MSIDQIAPEALKLPARDRALLAPLPGCMLFVMRIPGVFVIETG